MADEECKKEECPPGAPVWMCTFADLMSLLMCFFVLLLSFAVMDVTKYKEVAGAMKDAFGIQSEQPVTEEMKGQQMISASFESVPLHVQVQVARKFSEELGLPTRLNELGITEDRLPQMAEDAHADAALFGNPAKCSKEDLLALYKKAM